LLISNRCIAVDPNSSRSPRPGDIQIGHIATVQRSLLWPLADICRSDISEHAQGQGKGPWRDLGLRKLQRICAAKRFSSLHSLGGNVGRHQFAVAMPMSLISFDHLTTSLATRLENSSGVLPAGSAPSCDMRSRTSGVFSMRTTSPLILAIPSLGVPAGAKTPCHELIS